MPLARFRRAPRRWTKTLIAAVAFGTGAVALVGIANNAQPGGRQGSQPTSVPSTTGATTPTPASTTTSAAPSVNGAVVAAPTAAPAAKCRSCASPAGLRPASSPRVAEPLPVSSTTTTVLSPAPTHPVGQIGNGWALPDNSGAIQIRTTDPIPGPPIAPAPEENHPVIVKSVDGSSRCFGSGCGDH